MAIWFSSGRHIANDSVGKRPPPLGPSSQIKAAVLQGRLFPPLKFVLNRSSGRAIAGASPNEPLSATAYALSIEFNLTIFESVNRL
jgi:hypothetical protein